MPVLWALASLLIALFVLAVVIYLIKLIVGMLPLPDPAKTIAFILLGVLGLIGLIAVLSGLNITSCASLLCR